MSNVAEAQNLMQTIFPAHKHGNVKAAIWAAYRGLKLTTERRAETIWYGIAKRIDASEMDALREARAKQEAAQLAARFNQTAAWLRQSDPEFYQPTIDTLERVAFQLGDQDSPLAKE